MKCVVISTHSVNMRVPDFKANVASLHRPPSTKLGRAILGFKVEGAFPLVKKGHE